MLRHFFLLICFAFAFVSSTFAQVGGQGVYSFLNLTITPRSAALGSKVVALDESDPGVVLNNPSHLTSDLHNQLALSYVSYFADIKYGFVSYTKHYEGVGTFGIGLQHVGYGDFIEANSAGVITGSFNGYDMAFNLIYSRTFDSLFTVGINLKPIYSHLEQYNSFGVAADIGITYISREHLFAAGLTARNIGTMLKPYTPETWERLPFELIAGVSQKLKHAPFRFVVTFQQMQTTSLHYQRPKQNITFYGEEEEVSVSAFERIGGEFVSHLILGVEFVPVKNFYIRGGYNFQRRNELKIEERASTVGFSWGLGTKINKFHINYSRATYHLVGASNHFSISTDLDDFFVKKNL
ncbi:MAG: hypothetical protein CVT98_08235 [Bacteroidetes bacterium HGW-Bacteroidetes-15]|nr:MAG: hypothetical protein CVT98_08235 [Bacteroidetes bacterium HGW-Bacteroidetes-15]